MPKNYQNKSNYDSYKDDSTERNKAHSLNKSSKISHIDDKTEINY